MPEVRAPVDVEAIAIAHLKADAAVLAAPDDLEDRVSTELPGDRVGAWVKLDRLPGSTSAAPETAHVERARLQASIWAPTKTAAFDLTALVVQALFRLPDVAVFDYGVVTGVELEVTPYWAPDPETDEPRYLFVIALFVHP